MLKYPRGLVDIKKLLRLLREARKRKLLRKYKKKKTSRLFHAVGHIGVSKSSVGKITGVSVPTPPIIVKVKTEKGEEIPTGPVIIEYKPIKLPKFEEKEEVYLKDVASLILPKEVIDKLKKVHEKIPLIEVKLNGESRIMAYGEIKWNDEMQSLIYEVHEPKLSEREREILEELRKYIEEKLDIDFRAIRNVEEANKYIMEKMKEGLKKMGYKLDKDTMFKILYYLQRDFVGLEKIEPLMRDPDIEDISCDGVGIPVFIYHRNPMYGEMPTNIVFETKEELDNFIIKLAQKAGRAISVANPLLDGSLPDGSRVQATFGTDIARRGSNFTIRKFFRRVLTPIDLLEYGTLNETILAYYWLAVESRMSMLIAGPTASGKTTLLNAISLFIRPEMKIISIEDTAELKLPHPNWVPHVSRAAFGPSGYGAVTMFDLLKAALRQRPDYIIVGEVRGREAYVMFQAMATGHACYGTIHADSMDAIINRLTTPPINLPKQMITNLDLITFLIGTKIRGKFVRRVDQIVEITGYNYKEDEIITNTSFIWDPSEDKFIGRSSYLLDKIAKRLGYSSEELEMEMKRRVLVLKWMRRKRIRDYEKFWRIIGMYYYDPTRLLRLIRGKEYVGEI